MYVLLEEQHHEMVTHPEKIFFHCFYSIFLGKTHIRGLYINDVTLFWVIPPPPVVMSPFDIPQPLPPDDFLYVQNNRQIFEIRLNQGKIEVPYIWNKS